MQKKGLALKARHKDNQLQKTLDPWLDVSTTIAGMESAQKDAKITKR